MSADVNRLRVGMVVRRPEIDGNRPAERGVVVFAQGRGEHGYRRMYADDYVIHTSWMTSVIGNADSDWEEIPRDEWYASEAARSAMVSHIFPDWWDRDDGPPPERYLVDYAMLAALLPSGDRKEIDEGEFPSLLELILDVARELDLARGIDPEARGRAWQELALAALVMDHGGIPT